MRNINPQNDNLSVKRQNGESQNGSSKKAKHVKFSEKQTFLTPWYARTCENVSRAYHGVRNVRFSENLAWFAFLLSPFWDSPLCPITDELTDVFLGILQSFKEKPFLRTNFLQIIYVRLLLELASKSRTQFSNHFCGFFSLWSH